MKAKIYIISSVFFTVLVQRVEAQQIKNFVSMWTVKAATTDPEAVAAFPLSNAQQVNQYYDGLGRPIQTVAKQGSLKTFTGTISDLVSVTGYDFLGRQNTTYLPYVASTSDGTYKADAPTAQPAYYNGPTSPLAGQGEDGANAHSQTNFEPSPLNRPVLTMAPGNSWVGGLRGVGQQYNTNQPNEVILFAYDSSTGLLCLATGYYGAGQLYANKTTDEQGHEVIEYVDKEGRTVCKKVEAGTDANGKYYASTYYVYDGLGNLVVVLPPEGVKEMTK